MFPRFLGRRFTGNGRIFKCRVDDLAVKPFGDLQMASTHSKCNGALGTRRFASMQPSDPALAALNMSSHTGLWLRWSYIYWIMSSCPAVAAMIMCNQSNCCGYRSHPSRLRPHLQLNVTTPTRGSLLGTLSCRDPVPSTLRCPARPSPCPVTCPRTIAASQCCSRQPRRRSLGRCHTLDAGRHHHAPT